MGVSIKPASVMKGVARGNSSYLVTINTLDASHRRAEASELQRHHGQLGRAVGAAVGGRSTGIQVRDLQVLDLWKMLSRWLVDAG